MDEDPRFTKWWNSKFDPDETGRGRMLAHHGFLAGLAQCGSEFDRLRDVEAAAKRFDEAGSTVHQMSSAQWDAYTELKALFHGGIAFRT